MKLEISPGTHPGQLNSGTYPSGSGAERNSAQLMFKGINVLKCSYVMFKNAAPEQTWMTQHMLIAFPGAMLSFLLMLVGGHDVSGQEDHPPGVIAHTSDFHGDLPKSHGMRKSYSEIWKAEFSPMLLLTFLFSLSLSFFFFPFGPHSFIIIVTEFLLAASSLVLQQRNCHFEHLFLSLADNSSHTSKPSQIPPCMLLSEHLRSSYMVPSDPSPAAKVHHFHLILTLDLPTSHSLPTYLPTHTWIDLPTKPPQPSHSHPTFTLTCSTLIQAFFKSSKIMSSEKQKK